jgi:hypothetical protein
LLPARKPPRLGMFLVRKENQLFCAHSEAPGRISTGRRQPVHPKDSMPGHGLECGRLRLPTRVIQSTRALQPPGIPRIGAPWRHRSRASRPSVAGTAQWRQTRPGQHDWPTPGLFGRGCTPQVGQIRLFFVSSFYLKLACHFSRHHKKMRYGTYLYNWLSSNIQIEPSSDCVIFPNSGDIQQTLSVLGSKFRTPLSVVNHIVPSCASKIVYA